MSGVPVSSSVSVSTGTWEVSMYMSDLLFLVDVNSMLGALVSYLRV